jgi:hypothetical protein
VSDRERIAELLEDETRSFRSISRELGVSDWLVRKTARELDGDPRPMRRSPRQRADQGDDEGSPMSGWIVLAVVVGCFALMIWAGARWTPPPET